MNNEYEMAYRGIPKVTVELIDFCVKCDAKIKTEERIPEGVHCDTALKCEKCGDVRNLTVHIKMVEPS